MLDVFSMNCIIVSNPRERAPCWTIDPIAVLLSTAVKQYSGTSGVSAKMNVSPAFTGRLPDTPSNRMVTEAAVLCSATKLTSEASMLSSWSPRFSARNLKPSRTYRFFRQYVWLVGSLPLDSAGPGT